MRDFSSDGGSMNTILKGLGSNIAKLTGGITAVGAAFKVTTDTFKQSEWNIDEWGRTLKGAEGAYNTFLDTLNNGNWTAFFENLSTAVQGARDLYDALDKLGSVKANNQAAIALLQNEIARLKLMKQNGADVDDQIRDAEQRLVLLQSEAVDAGKEAGRKMMENTLRSAYQSQVGARRLNQGTLDKVIDTYIKQGDSFIERYQKTYQRLLKKGTVEKEVSYMTSTGQMATYTDRKFDINSLSKREQIDFRLAKAITDSETRLQEGLKIYTDAINEDTAIRREEFKTNRYILQGSNKGGSGTEKEELVFRPLASSMKEMKDNVTILSKKLEEMKVGSDDYVDTLRDLTYWQKKVKDQQTRDSDFSNFYSGKGYGQGIRVSPDTKIKALTPEEAQKLEKVKVPSARNANAKADDKEQMGAVKDIVAGVDGIVSSLETLGVDVPSGMKKGLKMIQTVITILEAVKAIQSAVQILTTGRDSVYQAAVVSELGIISAATVTTAGLQAVKSVPIIGWLLKEGGYVHAANGVVMGQNYIDRVPASLSSGEMVLNPAQQTKLFKMANEGGGGGAQSQPYVNAETIVCGIQNWAKRRGKGSELMFTQR
jgi:uncharacterized small protein (DUF1192 family)